MSPTPGRSTLITSAPNHASNCVHVGPDCTCVKSRIFTSPNALPISRSPKLICTGPARLGLPGRRTKQRQRHATRAGDGGFFAFKDRFVDDLLVRQKVALRLTVFFNRANCRIRRPSAVVDQLHRGQLKPISSKYFYLHRMPPCSPQGFELPCRNVRPGSRS